MHARPAHIIALAVLALLCLGVVMVQSALFTINPDAPTTLADVALSRTSLYMVLAGLAFAAAAALPVHRLKPSARHLKWFVMLPLPLALILLTVYAPGLGDPRNGSARWVSIPGINFTLQPSEIAKWGVIPFLAAFITLMGGRVRTFIGAMIPLGVAGVLCAIVVLEDLGTAALIGVVAAFMILAGGAKLWHMLAPVPVALAALAVAVRAEPYRMRRLTGFMNPTADPQGDGYHLLQSLSAIAGGGPSGRGLGHGVQKFGYLPEDHTDFLFAVICEELGLAGALLVCALFTAIILSCLHIARKATELPAKLYVLGVTATIALQALMNLFVVTGLAPTKGIALPLLSSGGTGWLLTSLALGIVAAIGRSQHKNAQTSATHKAAHAQVEAKPTGVRTHEPTTEPAAV